MQPIAQPREKLKPSSSGPTITLLHHFHTAVSRRLLLCAFAGMSVGCLDVLDTMLEGWASHLNALELVVYFAAGILLGLSVGVFSGLVLGIAMGAAELVGVVWSSSSGLCFKTKGILSSSHLAAALIVVITLWTLLILFSFAGIVTTDLRQVLVAVAFGGSILFVICTRLRFRIIAPVVWLILLAWVYLMETRVLYSFSRYGIARYLHAASGCFLVLLVAAALSKGFMKSVVQRFARYRFAPAAILVGGVLIFCTARFVSDRMSNDLKLCLYERTTILYRVFLLMPHNFEDVTSLRNKAHCGETKVDAATPLRPLRNEKIRGVIVILADALRGDHAPLSHRSSLTPSLARFALEGVNFTRAYTTLAATQYAVRSMMTGSPSLPKDNIPPVSAFLGTQLAKAGVRTISVADHINLKRSMENFDVFDPVSEDIYEPARRTNASHLSCARAKVQLEALSPGQRFFMFVHFYDPHNDYVPNDKFDFGSSLHERYDAEIAYADYWIGQLLNYMETHGFADDTAILIVGDHGDEFWEHRYRWHRVRLYEETVRVPMFIKLPGGQSGKTVDTPVSIADIAPTVLNLFGLDTSTAMGGVSLAPIVKGASLPNDRAVFTASPQYKTFAAIADNHKLIINQDAAVDEYYDLAADPKEQNNLSDDMDVRTTPLYCTLTNWMAAHE
jgi:arylsulfatase A-like enzyme